MLIAWAVGRLWRAARVLRRGGGEVAARRRRVLGIRMRQSWVPRNLRQSQQILAVDRRNHRQALVNQSQGLGRIWVVIKKLWSWVTLNNRVY